ncbi:hypothetical protein OG453_00750 [Streptomyces sp. NBC_01381]|uniref:hypothetical protein n=1 Tax=Streptomyces sp. NBC_01381 TaxID=2903845 RepID=UPI002250A5AE|nr:hypothetical protein [Streptomyces sp. NBC_01381]MCX4665214.1 hypothetical protein [Streptomyces sp. NBC_01381]
MNRSRVLPAAVSLTAAAALLLTGCGGDDGDSGKDKAAGGADAKKSASPSPKKSEAPAIERPAMKFPSDVRLVFEKSELTDPDQAAALNDAQNYARSTVYGIVKQDPENAAYKFYSEPGSDAREYAKSQIRNHSSADFSVTGERSHSDAKVQPGGGADKKGMVVTFCSDESKMSGKDLRTKEKIPFEPGPKNYWFWRIEMVPSKSTDGLWLAQKAKVKDEAEQCRR